MPKNQVTRTRENNDPAGFSSKPMLDENKAERSQKEGPAAYAPHDDEPESKTKNPEGERAFPDRDPARKKTGEF